MLHKRAIFFDRDGTILVPPAEYLSKPEQVKFYPGVPEAIALLNGRGFRIVVVTNQAAVGRGMISEMDLLRVHNHMKRALAERGAALDAVLYSPYFAGARLAEHRRRADERKPATGLFDEAARRFKLSLKDSFVVGDSPVDIEAAHNIGAQAVLVRTGKGDETERSGGAGADRVTDDAAEAAVWICRQVCDTPLKGKSVLFVLAGRNFQDREYRVTRLALEAWGADVRVAGPARDECVSAEGVRVRPDMTVRSALDASFDAVVFIGGEGARALLACAPCQALARDAYERKKVVAAICIAPSILANAHLLAKRHAVAWHTELSNLRKHGARVVARPVVRDGHVVTAAGPRDAETFADAIRAALRGEKIIEMTVASRAEAS